ncbi:fimbrial usher protein PixC [Escherichia coli]|uniref:Fimbrial usher protein PixC n=1 Tax=Escherichia coli TaxID=562 RepID=A0A376L4E2_ECOLX|nr:fimbrial usher protein PixC [Escherichia coli]
MNMPQRGRYLLPEKHHGGSVINGRFMVVALLPEIITHWLLVLGRDLSQFGTLSADVTQSVARIPREETKQGKSWSLRYSKRFDDVDADIQFAGYRFSERNYMTMQQYLDARYRHDFTGREKEQYDISLNKSLEDGKTSVSLQYSHSDLLGSANVKLLHIIAEPLFRCVWFKEHFCRGKCLPFPVLPERKQ